MKRAGFLIGCSSAALWPRAGLAAALDGTMAQLDAQSSGKLAVYARALGHDEPIISYRADDDMPAASTIKLLIMVTAFRRQELVDPQLFKRKVTLTAEQFVGGSEFLDSANPGDKFTVSSLVYAMITLSDNTASNALIDLFGFDEINKTAADIGLTHTHLRRHFLDANAIVKHIQNRTSASDMGRLVYKIESGAHEAVPTVASATACRKMVDIMLHQEDRDKIPEGLPKGVTVANKTGEIDGVRNDVAIVDPFGERPYVLSVFTKELGNYTDGLRAIHIVARESYKQVHG
jgi:beta-lactamase class A